jgi:hypothetical protein
MNDDEGEDEQEYDDNSVKMDGNEDSQEDDEEEDEVDDMVKAAAQWLTKRDPSSSNSEVPKSKGRGLPMRKAV